MLWQGWPSIGLLIKAVSNSGLNEQLLPLSMERCPRATLKSKGGREGVGEREGGRETEREEEFFSPSPKKQASDSLLLTTIVKKWGKAIRNLGRGEGRVSVADADTWPHLTSPKAASLSTNTAGLSQSSGCAGAKTRKPFYSALAVCSAQHCSQFLSEAACWVGGAFATTIPLVHTLPRPKS